MKKTIYTLAAISIFAVALTSCGKKDFTCTCTGSGFVERAVIPEATKQQAETICKGFEAYEFGNTKVATCKLD